MGEPQSVPEWAGFLERLEAVEREVRETNEVQRQLAEAISGIASNQQTMAVNQRLIIEGLARLAERITGPMEGQPLFESGPSV
jgi:hypothetical protein